MHDTHDHDAHDDIDAALRDAFPSLANAAFLRRCHRWRTGPARTLLTLGHPDYPALLRRLPDAPRVLFVHGDVARLWHPSVAVVGTRTPTVNGQDNARLFAGELTRRGWSIASGMASGIDTVAHRAALEAPGGCTVAVLGSGVDVAFPVANRSLLRAIAERGAAVSEMPPGTPAAAWQFPRRNRIVAGLSLGTLVVEAAQRSGALITARLAGDASREVFAIPGSIHNPYARGCHRLIRDGAQLVESVDDIESALAPIAAAFADDLRGRLHVPISNTAAVQHDSCDKDEDTQRLWDALGHDPTPMEVLVVRTGLTAAKLASILLSMELEGRVECQHGRYTRRGTRKSS
jgi:DNA processing protein